jgi:hypothetical protein
MERRDSRESQHDQKIINWIRGAVLGSLGKRLFRLVVGNLFHPLPPSRSSSPRRTRTASALRSKVYDAILDEDLRLPLWPASGVGAPHAAEARRRHYTFNKEMRNQVGTEDSPFPENTVTFHDRS